MEEQRQTRSDPRHKRDQPDRGHPAGEEYEIPPEGSLGLLAVGAVGIVEWRYARERARKEAEAARAAETTEADSEQDGKPASEDE